MKRVCIAEKLFVIILLISLVNHPGFCQTNRTKYPTIGDKCPAFILDNLYFYSSRKASYQDFKGKPIILNFFSTGCGSSFESLPHLAEMEKAFEGRVQFILIGRPDEELKIQYEKYRKHYHLNFPVDFADSALWNQFGAYYVAHTVWIDSAGIIRQTTTPYALNKETIENLLAGKGQTLNTDRTLADLDDYFNGVSYFDPEKPYLINGNGGNDTSYSYRSIFSKWDYRTDFHIENFIGSNNGNKLIETGASLEALYKLAYGDTVEFQMPVNPRFANAPKMNTYPEWSNNVLLETKRKDLFDADNFTGNNVFTYSLEVPDNLASAKSLQSILQRELMNYFGFNVRIETRLQPCWKLIADPNKIFSLKTKGGKPFWD
jgi:thiol-disulfide isomerase/thioredoxin